MVVELPGKEMKDGACGTKWPQRGTARPLHLLVTAGQRYEIV
jgi:hypothetical protein